MLEIMTNDGDILRGSPEDVVQQLMTMERLRPTSSPSAFMQIVARRAHLWNDALVSTRSAIEFLRDLANADLILLEEDLAEERT